MGRVCHFEIHAEQPERAIKFYTDVFGWRFDKFQGPWDYWLITTGDEHEPGINGGLVVRRGKINGDSLIAYVCTVKSNDIDGDQKKILDAGGTMALDKMPIPGVGWLFYAKDTEGNIFGVMQDDPQASF